MRLTTRRGIYRIYQLRFRWTLPQKGSLLVDHVIISNCPSTFAKEEPAKPVQTSLGRAFAKAGMLVQDVPDLGPSEEIAGEKVSELRKLTYLVMVPAQYGLSIPINLLLRSLGRLSTSSLGKLLKTSRFLIWLEDEVGNISIGARHPLEAKLLLQERLGGPDAEFEYVKLLLLGLSTSDDEIDFAIELLRNIGPNNPERKKRFAGHFKEISRTLSRLRTEYSVTNVRLMLQEAFFLRESTRDYDQVSPAVLESDLIDAEAILKTALELADTNNRRLKSKILAELGTVMVSRARTFANNEEGTENQLKILEHARSELYRARREDYENAYPIDVLARMTLDIAKARSPNDPKRAEAETDLLNLYEMCDAEQPAFIHAQEYWSRREEVLSVIGKDAEAQSAFDTLAELGSTSGYYMRARRIAGELPLDRPLTEEERRSCKKAYDYLNQNLELLKSDGKCNFLMLKYWWMFGTGSPIFFSERQVLSFSDAQWDEAASILERLENAGETFYTPSMRFLHALSLFHLRDFKESLREFKLLAFENLHGVRRVTPSYVASENSKAKVFSGEINEDGSLGGKGWISVPEISLRIPFFPKHFNQSDIRKHRTISFHIAFNFLGPFADPIGHRK